MPPQRGRVCATDFRRLFSRATVERRRDRKQPARSRRILPRIGIIDVGSRVGSRPGHRAMRKIIGLNEQQHARQREAQQKH